MSPNVRGVKLRIDARVLPLNLGETMLALPQRPITPILLLVTSICVILAIVVHGISISGWDWKCRRVNGFTSKSKSGSGMGSKKSVDDGYFDQDSSSKFKSGSKPHPAFLCLVGIAVVLGIAAAAVERRSINKALETWDESTASSIGLTASLGPLAHRTPTASFIFKRS